jgi:protoporphyrinogen oxidase
MEILDIVTYIGGWAALTVILAVFIAKYLSEMISDKLKIKWSGGQEEKLEKLRAEITHEHSIFTSNSRSLILFSSKLSKIIPPPVVDLPYDMASRSMQYHKMFTNWHVNKPSLVCVYSHNGNS